MAALVAAIHEFFCAAKTKNVDARNKSGHDEVLCGHGWANTPDHGAVHGGDRVGQHGGMSQDTTRKQGPTMQDDTIKTATTAANPALGRSSVAKLPPDVREAVDKAIADGATIDEITARIRAEGETCSRSAVGRYAKERAR